MYVGRRAVLIAAGLVLLGSGASGGIVLAQGFGLGMGVPDMRRVAPGPPAPIILLTGGTNLLTGGTNLLKE